MNESSPVRHGSGFERYGSLAKNESRKAIALKRLNSRGVVGGRVAVPRIIDDGLSLSCRFLLWWREGTSFVDSDAEWAGWIVGLEFFFGARISFVQHERHYFDSADDSMKKAMKQKSRSPRKNTLLSITPMQTVETTPRAIVPERVCESLGRHSSESGHLEDLPRTDSLHKMSSIVETVNEVEEDENSRSSNPPVRDVDALRIAHLADISHKQSPLSTSVRSINGKFI